MLRTIILCLISCFILASCGNENKPVNKQKPKTENTKKKKTSKKKDNSAYWISVKKELKLTKEEVTQLKKIQENYNKAVRQHKKKKKWYGDNNAKTRSNLFKNKEEKIEKALGTKYNRWVKYRKNKDKK